MVKKSSPRPDQTREELLTFFGTLANYSSREMEKTLTKLSVEAYAHTPEVFQALLEDSVNPPTLEFRFYAFFCLATIYRRKKDITKFKELDARFGSLFTNFPLYWHLISLLYRQNKMNYAMAFESAQKAMELLPRHAGVLHSYAEIIVMISENKREELDQKLLESAVSAVNQALDIESNYAKFYCTKGRLLALQGKFDEGQEYILKAIDKENSDSKDYAIRINEYMYYMTLIEREQMLDLSNRNLQEVTEKANKIKLDFEKSTQELKLSLDEVRTQNLQILGFFTAILSFTIASIQIISDQTFKDSALLIVVLIGALLTGYAGFFALMPSSQTTTRRLWVVALAGIGLILTSVSIHYFVK